MTPELRAHVMARRRIARAVSGRAVPRRLIRPQPVPWGPIRSYVAELRQLVDYLRKTTTDLVHPQLAEWVADADRTHARADGAPDDAAQTFAGIRLSMEQGAFSRRNVKPVAEKAARRTAQTQKEALQKQLALSIGVQVPIFDKTLGPLVEQFTAQNVALITSIPTQALQQVEQVVLRGLADGQRAEELAVEISRRFDVAESRGALIARDQTLKFHASLNEVRQRELGITHFVWATDNDERVCPICAPLDEKRFTWANAPGGGPGKIHPNCRCSADPDVEALLRSL